MKLKPWIRVVESKTAPKTEILGGMLVPLEDKSVGSSSEPIGNRTSKCRLTGISPKGSATRRGGAHVTGGEVVPGKTAAIAAYVSSASR